MRGRQRTDVGHKLSGSAFPFPLNLATVFQDAQFHSNHLRGLRPENLSIFK